MATPGNELGARVGLVALVALLIGCTHEVEGGFAPHQGPTPVGTIGSSAPSNDEGDEGDASSEDEESTADDGEVSEDEGTPVEDDGSAEEEAGSAPAEDTGAPLSEGGADTGSGDPVLDACLEVATNDCETCGCNLCLDPLYACEQDPGCVAMRNCAEQTGCSGAECLEPCGAVIDMYGGPFGDSGALALALSDCLTAQCPQCF